MINDKTDNSIKSLDKPISAENSLKRRFLGENEVSKIGQKVIGETGFEPKTCQNILIFSKI